MTISQLTQAFPTLQKIVNFDLPIKKAYDIFCLAKLFNEQKEFFIDKERKLINKYNGKISDAGQITFDNVNDKANFAREYAELNNFEVAAAPISLKFTDFGEQRLSPMEIMSLDGIISFED